MTPRYTWTPASDPPDTSRYVLVWKRYGGPAAFEFYSQKERRWSSIHVTHWRDVEPPEAGE